MSLVKKIGNTGLHVLQGDITQLPADAVMTAINSAGVWAGGVDRAIMRIAGRHYHMQAYEQMPLSDGQVVVAKGDREMHNGQFNDVVFVVDDLEVSVDNIVYAGLEAAHMQNYGKILVPAVRMGIMAGEVEKTPEETVAKLGKGIDDFMMKYGGGTNLKDITFVVYGDNIVFNQLNSGLGDIPLSTN